MRLVRFMTVSLVALLFGIVTDEKVGKRDESEKNGKLKLNRKILRIDCISVCDTKFLFLTNPTHST